MDPYIEDRGLRGDFHTKLIGEIERTLAPALPERYFVQANDQNRTRIMKTITRSNHLKHKFYPAIARTVAEILNTSN